jgi:D-beta-D-heptose 7-phosphate kinase/D-beta-D-heptose 1-phosphate adenosyltransferase
MWRRAAPIIQRFDQLKVLILGDVMLDEYIWGTVHRISPEAPVPVVSVKGRTAVPGGAANVAANVAALGAAVAIVGLVGADQEGGQLSQLLASLPVDCSGMVVDQERPTTTKIRIIAERQQVVRMDQEETTPIPPALAAQLVEATRRALDGRCPPQALILSDYGKGCLAPDLLKEVIEEAHSRGIFVAVDPKGRDFRKYRGVNVLTPNRHETELACGFPIDHEQQVPHAMEVLLDQTDADGLLITLSKDGMAVGARSQGIKAPRHQGIKAGRKHAVNDLDASMPRCLDACFRYWRIPSEAREVYDVTGAGDTVVSAFVLAFLVSHSWEQAARIANAAAGMVVGRVGTATVRQQELLAHVQAQEPTQRSKALS